MAHVRRADAGAVPVRAYVALGANLGDRFRNMQGAVDRLSAANGVQVTRTSPVYESPAHVLDPGTPQPSFLNAVIELLTTCSAQALLETCMDVERAGGRERRERWSARTIDLDLLMHGTEAVSEPDLRLPHPRLGDRRFVLRPLADLVPDLIVPPPFAASVYSLLKRTPDRGEVRRYPMELTVPQHGFFGGRGGNDV